MYKKIISLVVGAAAVGGSAFLIRKKINQSDAGTAQKAPLSPAHRGMAVPPPAPKSSDRERMPIEDKKTASVNFFAGIKAPKEMTLSIKYDAVRYEWKILEEEFPAITSAIYTGFIWGEDVSLQIEIPDFINAASFEEQTAQLSAKYGELKPVTYGEWSGFTYVDGDLLRAALQIPGAEDYYLLVAIIKEHKCDVDFRELRDNIDVIEMISSIQIS